MKGNVGDQHTEEPVGVEAGIVRKIDDLGRIVIPAETRRLFNIREGDQLLISIEGTGITIRKMESTCAFCGRTEDVMPFKGRGICNECRSQLH
ncbi:MAG: AbrB/MazE/SpoVT family DNA-binding domain-containing protein [Actinomycetota bacterium]|nr:AbrB/MazE/SpoVT family DNA-binding domain-containing protein [Actinomycetota bacterium]